MARSAAALSRGRLIKTWAMRGTLHLLTPEEGGAFLSLMASGRSWERPSWQKYFGVSPDQIESLRVVVRQALDGQVLTREELVADGHPRSQARPRRGSARLRVGYVAQTAGLAG